MNSFLGHLHFVSVYLDDILIFSKNEEKHCHHLRQVLTILKDKDISSLTMAFDLPQTSSLLSRAGQPQKREDSAVVPGIRELLPTIPPQFC